MKELGKFCKIKNNEIISMISRIRHQEVSYYNQLNRDQGHFRDILGLLI